jgi:hypothetical protein
MGGTMSNLIPNDAYAMIIGAMKCGTTSLANYLQGHPELCLAFKKEPEFFSERQSHKVQVEHYNDLFSFDNSIHKYALEASTGYTKYPHELNVPKNIYEYGIRPKFIYIIRNPFDRIISHFNFMRVKTTWVLNVDSEHLINTSKYFLQLEQYRQYFPLDDILILDFNDLKTDPAQVLRQIYNFLQISQSYFPEVYEVAKPVQVSPLKKRIQSSRISPLLSYIPKPLKQFGENALRGNSSAKNRVLTAEEKDFIYSQLKDDMSNLQRTYGFNVKQWGW